LNKKKPVNITKAKETNIDTPKADNNPPTEIIDTNQFQQIVEPKYEKEEKIEIPKPEPIPENNEEDELEDIDEIEENNNEQQYADIKTTSSMRSKLKGPETKERVKLLMKRSMSSDKLSKARKDMANQALNEALELNYGGIADMTPEKQIKSDLSKLNMLNNPISKQIDEDAVSVHSRGSKNMSSAQSIASDSKISNYVRMLKNEIEKEKSAKDNALSILKGLKKKDKEVENVINELSK